MTYLNNAIIQVISHQYKKDVKQFHQIVEAAGYKIEKYDGCYRVSNPKTYRYCYMIDTGFYSGRERWVLYWGSHGYGSKVIYGDPINAKVDLTNMLNTPYNKWSGMTRWEQEGNHSKAMEKYVQLKNYKQSYETQIDETNKILHQISELQNRLIKETEYKVKCITKLNNYREEIGLKRRDNV